MAHVCLYTVTFEKGGEAQQMVPFFYGWIVGFGDHRIPEDTLFGFYAKIAEV